MRAHRRESPLTRSVVRLRPAAASARLRGAQSRPIRTARTARRRSSSWLRRPRARWPPAVRRRAVLDVSRGARSGRRNPRPKALITTSKRDGSKSERFAIHDLDRDVVQTTSRGCGPRRLHHGRNDVDSDDVAARTHRDGSRQKRGPLPTSDVEHVFAGSERRVRHDSLSHQREVRHLGLVRRRRAFPQRDNPLVHGAHRMTSTRLCSRGTSPTSQAARGGQPPDALVDVLTFLP